MRYWLFLLFCFGGFGVYVAYDQGQDHALDTKASNHPFTKPYDQEPNIYICNKLNKNKCVHWEKYFDKGNM